jgi:hypothetical protein
MATATKTNEVVQVVQPAKVVLELSLEEAQFLTDVLCAVAGDPKKTRRGHQENISNSLYRLGFSFPPYGDPKRDWTGSLLFEKRVDTTPVV